MSSGGKRPKKPKGWYSKAARSDRRAAREAVRLTRQLGRAEREADAAKRLALLEPLRASTVKALARLPKPTKPYSGAAAVAAARMQAAAAKARRHDLVDKWRPWEGTPETNERIASVPEHRRQSPLARMARLGKITADELADANEIASVVEMIERGVSVRSASLEARVDYAGSGRDALIESLGRIRLEIAYTAWRKAIPNPKRMIIDMLTSNVSFVECARAHGMHWRTARKKLMTAIRIWPRFKYDARKDVGNEEVQEVYSRLGEGTLLAPKPKTSVPLVGPGEDKAA